MIDDSARIRWLTRHGLGVTCETCFHRAVLHPDHFGVGHGIMRKLTHLPLRCSKCGGRRVDLTLFLKQSERTRFMRE
jgi:hypothetical protein